MTFKFSKLAVLTFVSIALASCSNSQDGAHSKMDHSEMDHANMDHSKMETSESGANEGAMRVGQTTGTILSVSPDGQQLTIDHGAIEAIGMGAMTMGFVLSSDLDFEDIEVGDEVSFRVRMNDTGQFEITEICSMIEDGIDCLD